MTVFSPCMVLKWLVGCQLTSLLSIRADGLFRIGFATGANNAGQFVNVKGDVTKGDADIFPLGGNDGVFGPGVCLRLLSWELPVVGQADTPRIEIPRIPYASQMLRVGVSSCQQRRIEPAEQLAQGVL